MEIQIDDLHQLQLKVGKWGPCIRGWQSCGFIASDLSHDFPLFLGVAHSLLMEKNSCFLLWIQYLPFIKFHLLMADS